LVLGAAPAVSTYVLPALLVRYTGRYPNVRLVVRTGHSEEILELALRREIDLGLVRELRHPDIESRPLYDDELVLVAAGSHHFGDRTTVGIHELEGARLILFDRTSSYYELTNAFFREAGVAPGGVMELDNIDAAKQMVGQGLGVALLPHTSVAAELADGRLRAIDIEGAAPIRRRIVAIRRRDIGPATGPVSGFLEVLSEVDEVLPH
jgi:DNA-binding transcriptional LysR family regulator